MEPETPKNYDTLVEALNDLKDRGYTKDLNHNIEAVMRNHDWQIHEVHRFEGSTNPSDSSVLIAMEDERGVKGTVVAAYGTYTDEVVAECLKRAHN